MNYSPEWPSTHITLLNRVRFQTDSEAWREFVGIYGPLIYNYCRKFHLKDCDAEDVCQEVFRKISTSMHSFEYNRQLGRFRSWLGTVTYHEIYSTALNNIQPLFDNQTWKAFELTWIEDLGAQQASEKLGAEITWIYKAKFLVQKKLKEEIQRLSFDSVVFQK